MLHFEIHKDKYWDCSNQSIGEHLMKLAEALTCKAKEAKQKLPPF